MRSTGKIVFGLLVFLALATIPFWMGAGAREEVRPPDLVLGVAEGTTHCVQDAETMRRDHMQLLMEWRDEVVRKGERVFVTEDGRRYVKSLTGTCLGCHSDAKGFCFRCHDYAGVETPYCWECHVVPEGGR